MNQYQTLQINVCKQTILDEDREVMFHTLVFKG